MATKYKVILLGMAGFKTQESKPIATLKQAHRYILNNLKPGGHFRPAWIYRITGDKETKLPGQYEIWRKDDTGFKTALYRRTEHPNRLGVKPIMFK